MSKNTLVIKTYKADIELEVENEISVEEIKTVFKTNKLIEADEIIIETDEAIIMTKQPTRLKLIWNNLTTQNDIDLHGKYTFRGSKNYMQNQYKNILKGRVVKTPKNTKNTTPPLRLTNPLAMVLNRHSKLSFSDIYNTGMYTVSDQGFKVYSQGSKEVKELSQIIKWSNYNFTNKVNSNPKIEEPFLYHFVLKYIISNLISDIREQDTQTRYFIKSIRGISEKSFDGFRYSAGKGDAYSKLYPSIRNVLFDDYVHLIKVKNSIRTETGYKLKNSDVLYFKLVEFLIDTDVKPKGDVNNLICISKTDFMRLELRDQLICLGHLKYIQNGNLYCLQKVIKGRGNCGRYYGLISFLTSSSRKQMSNLFGYDINTAVQSIVCSLFPDLDLPFSRSYINNKQATRAKLASELSLSIEEVKTLITAIYQGQKLNGVIASVDVKIYNSWNDESKELIQSIIDERDLILNEVIKTINDKDKNEVKYSIKSTDDKLKKEEEYKVKDYDRLNKDKQFELAKTYLFFYWTYFEGEIRKVIAKHFKYPIHLHDAVYTQNKDEYDNFNVEEVENKIFEETGILISLSIA